MVGGGVVGGGRSQDVRSSASLVNVKASNAADCRKLLIEVASRMKWKLKPAGTLMR